jgi:hypothetical protein
VSRYYADGRCAVERRHLAVGDRIRLVPDARHWWTVQAVSEHFTACVQQAPFKPKGTLQYTVLDWRNGVRGPCNLIGQGYGDGSYSPEECARMLADFEGDSDRLCPLAVSQRNWVPLEVLEVAA